MKFKKAIFYLFIFLSVFLIYKFTYNRSINFVALGDSLAYGKYSYGEKNYSYNDYIRDYLSNNNILHSYNSNFIKVDCSISELTKEILYNSKLKRSLRESDLLTISVGIDEIDRYIRDADMTKSSIDHIYENFDVLIKEVRKYAKNKIILIGVYNPYPHFDRLKKEIDQYITQINNIYREIANNNGVDYIDIFYEFSNKKYFPNPISIYPSYDGHGEIYKRIKPMLDEFIKN